MARVALAHTDLTAKGGGEAVGVRALEALQGDHEVHLLTLTDPDLAELEAYFDADVDPVPVHRPDGLAGRLAREASRRQRYNLENALLNRFVGEHAGDYDLVVSTDNELSPSPPCLQYIHTPRFARLVVSKRVGQDSFVDHAYDRLCYRLGGYEAQRIQASQLLANSDWMADIVQAVYDVRPDVVHPPVHAEDMRQAARPWDEREPGFVAIGRLAPWKNLEDVIAIVDGVRERGHDVHLHIAGPVGEETYAERIRSLAAPRDHVQLEGELSRAELADLAGRHRYGLHGKRHEHFGIVVAELVAAGAIPFVPDQGGQREIVDHREELVYDTVPQAVDRIDAVLSEPKRQAELRRTLGAVEERFGCQRFREEIRAHVQRLIEA